VLAVVAAGLYLGWRLPEIFTSQTRLRAGPVWETVEFLLNGFVFILIGLQLPEILKTLSKDSDSVRHLVWPALVISVAVILVRILWVFPAAYFPRLFSKGLRKRDPYPTWQSLTILAWTGMRGVVSLAAALALPMAIRNGNPFPDRELILFLTFIVIVVTLVGQGLSLPFVIRLLHMEEDLSFEQEELKARLQANKAALEKLTETPENDPAKADARQRLRIEYEDHIRQLESNEPDTAGTPLRLFSSEFERLSQAALNEERRTIIDLRNRRAINDEVLRRIQRDIDLAEARLRHHQ
jgi:CPA1 family monovalent cation:H+ antiporter